jgi:hypothetical protein
LLRLAALRPKDSPAELLLHQGRATLLLAATLLSTLAQQPAVQRDRIF